MNKKFKKRWSKKTQKFLWPDAALSQGIRPWMPRAGCISVFGQFTDFKLCLADVPCSFYSLADCNSHFPGLIFKVYNLSLKGQCLPLASFSEVLILLCKHIACLHESKMVSPRSFYFEAWVSFITCGTVPTNLISYEPLDLFYWSGLEVASSG
jgi:hypothetical protein